MRKPTDTVEVSGRNEKMPWGRGNMSSTKLPACILKDGNKEKARASSHRDGGAISTLRSLGL